MKAITLLTLPLVIVASNLHAAEADMKSGNNKQEIALQEQIQKHNKLSIDISPVIAKNVEDNIHNTDNALATMTYHPERNEIVIVAHFD